MKIRVAASGVSDSKGKGYPQAAIPDPEAWRKFKADQAALNEVHESQIGRNAKLVIPRLRKGIELKRGGASVELTGVDEDYVKMLRADHTLMVDVLPEKKQLSQE